MEEGAYEMEDCISVYCLGNAYLLTTRNHLLIVQERESEIVLRCSVAFDDCCKVYCRRNPETNNVELCFVCMRNYSLFQSRWDRIQLKLEEVCVNMGKSADTEKRCEKLIGIIENERRNHSYSKNWVEGVSCSLEISVFFKYLGSTGVNCLLNKE